MAKKITSVNLVWKFDEYSYQIKAKLTENGECINILFPEANVTNKYLVQLSVNDDRDYIDFDSFDSCEEAIEWIKGNIKTILKQI